MGDNKRKLAEDDEVTSTTEVPVKKAKECPSGDSESDAPLYSADGNSACRKKHSKKKKSKKSKSKHERKHKHHKKCKLRSKHDKKESKSQEETVISEEQGNIGPEVPGSLADPSKLMAPVTKEEYEKQQNTVRKVYDEETGRHRLIKGDGEIIEEIVSKSRQQEINKQATASNAAYFADNIKKLC